MYKCKNASISILFLLVLWSCSNKDAKVFDNNPLFISIKEADFNVEHDFYNIINDIEFVPLETTDESIMGEVSKMKMYNGYMIILDKKSRTVFIFDNKGKYLNKISRVGTGPYEYEYINDFCVHPLTGEISIATSSRKILTFSFDLKRCTLFDKTPYAVGIERFNNGNYALASTDIEANVYVTDSSMNILQKCLANPFKNTSCILNSFTKFGDTILCRLPTFYNDTIYRITSDSFIPWCAPDFEYHADFSNMDKYFVETPPIGKMFFNPEMSMSSSGFYLETNKLISFQVVYPKKYGDRKICYVIYSKQDKRVKVIDPAKVINSPFDLFFRFSGSGIQSDVFMQRVSAAEILNCKILKEDAIGLRIKDLKARLNEESNPVIMFMKFKE